MNRKRLWVLLALVPIVLSILLFFIASAMFQVTVTVPADSGSTDPTWVPADSGSTDRTIWVLADQATLVQSASQMLFIFGVGLTVAVTAVLVFQWGVAREVDRRLHEAGFPGTAPPGGTRQAQSGTGRSPPGPAS